MLYVGIQKPLYVRFETMKNKMRVAPGNRYRKTDDTDLIWVVKSVYTPNGFDTHVRAHPDNDPSDVRLYAASIFGDPRFFDAVHVQVETESLPAEKTPLFGNNSAWKPAE
jgi:hypothetical protein